MSRASYGPVTPSGRPVTRAGADYNITVIVIDFHCFQDFCRGLQTIKRREIGVRQILVGINGFEWDVTLSEV